MYWGYQNYYLLCLVLKKLVPFDGLIQFPGPKTRNIKITFNTFNDIINKKLHI